MTTLDDQTKEIHFKEKLKRELEQRYEPQRMSLHEFVKLYREVEKKEILEDNWHIKEVCSKLEMVYTGEIKRLMINIPPRSLKTEIVSKAFPIWCLGHEPNLKFIETSYSAELAQRNSSGARDMYQSIIYGRVFPRKANLKDDQNTKANWETVEDGQMYATGATGTIIGIGADIIIIDDPMKPDDAESDLMRRNVINNYHDTIKSRLNSKVDGAIVIIMQRLHDNDLCGHLIEQERLGIGEKWEKVIVPAIIEGKSFFEKRFPLVLLKQMQKEMPVTFSTQYLQEPVNAESQEFHQEWFRYYNDEVKGGRIFTTVDPAFSKNDKADNSAIVTGMFKDMELYILEYSVGKYNPAELQDEIIKHYRKRNPEKIGIEAFQAQAIIGFNLKAELEKLKLSVDIQEIRQSGDKETKIRKLIPLYRNSHIWHRPFMQELEHELLRFPRGRHDDIIDAVQMLYSMYDIQPHTNAFGGRIEIKYGPDGRPIGISNIQAAGSEFQIPGYN